MIIIMNRIGSLFSFGIRPVIGLLNMNVTGLSCPRQIGVECI